MLEGLTKWLNVGRETNALMAKEIDMWVMIVYAQEQGT